MIKNYSKCKLCSFCNGRACIGELPGMGGVFQNKNFIKNCIDWQKYFSQEINRNDFSDLKLPSVRLAPMTGALENAGYHDEKRFYFDLIGASINAGIELSIGDGFPDLKFQYGIDALSHYKKKAAVFIKPYPQNKIFERVDLSKKSAEIIGVDIDAYNIITMRNLVKLEKKTSKDLYEIKKYSQLPFAVKGVFTQENIQLIKELKPDIAIISNHGGRVEIYDDNRQPVIGSTADFLYKFGSEIAKYTNEVWVDGGIRCKEDLVSAKILGAVTVLIGRPFISGILKDKKNGIANFMKTLTFGL